VQENLAILIKGKVVDMIEGLVDIWAQKLKYRGGGHGREG
jgi:hypothetical protein